ncbi:MAG: hypothetical protein AAGG75_05270 [Bacteroidota bacterium]
MENGSTDNDQRGTAATRSPDAPLQNFGLSLLEFEEMLEKLQAGDETLFKQVFLSQFEDSVQYLIRRYNIHRSLAYDVTMDALLKFRRRLLAGKIGYGNMRFLFTRMASQFLADSSKHQTFMLSESEENQEQRPPENEETLNALDWSWNQLGKECRALLENFYYHKIALKIMALRLEKSETAVRKQKQRCLEKLRHYFLKHNHKN